MMANVRTNKGVSLIEVLVVAAIIALLSIAGMLTVNTQLKKGRDGRRRMDIDLVRKYIEEYANDSYQYPDEITFSAMINIIKVNKAKLADVKDPGAFQYTYASLDGGDTYCLCAQLEMEDGNSDGDCNFSSAATHFCQRNLE